MLSDNDLRERPTLAEHTIPPNSNRMKGREEDHGKDWPRTGNLSQDKKWKDKYHNFISGKKEYCDTIGSSDGMCKCFDNTESCGCLPRWLEDDSCRRYALDDRKDAVDCMRKPETPTCGTMFDNVKVGVVPSESSPLPSASATLADVNNLPATTIEAASATAADSIVLPTPTIEASNSSPTTTSAAVQPNIGIIVGAAVGGLVLIALIALATLLLCRRRRRQRRKAPSAEFLESNGSLRRILTAGSLPIESPPTSVYGTLVLDATFVEGLPPAFSPGSFRDPVVEKVATSAQAIAAYQQRDATMDADKESLRYGNVTATSSRGTRR